jgi:hypothetical protein
VATIGRRGAKAASNWSRRKRFPGLRGEWYRASETLLRRDSLSDFNDGCKDFAELRALIVQARATAMNDGDPGPARRPNFDIVRDELVMA